MMRSTVTGTWQTEKRQLTDDVFHCDMILTDLENIVNGQCVSQPQEPD